MVLSWRRNNKTATTHPDPHATLPMRCIGDLGPVSETDGGIYYGLGGTVTGKELIQPNRGQILSGGSHFSTS